MRLNFMIRYMCCLPIIDNITYKQIIYKFISCPLGTYFGQ